MVIRHETAAARTEREPLLTEEHVRAGSPVARLVARRPWVMDVTVAGAMLVVGLFGSVWAGQTAAGGSYLGAYPPGPAYVRTATTTWLAGAAVGAGLLLVRRLWPLTVTALLTVAALASLVVGGVLGVLGACLACALYGVAAARSTRTTWVVFGAVLTVVTVALWRWQDLGISEVIMWSSVPADPSYVADYDGERFSSGSRVLSVLLLAALLLLGVAVGSAARARRLHAAELVERYRALARERDQGVTLARATERAHIAREMHDVVAHSVSVMVALADGADAAFERAPEHAREAVRQVARTGRSAMVDMQRVLGALGPADGPADGAADGATGAARQVEPAEVDLATVVARFRTAGLPVSATGLEADLPDDVSVRLAVVRILGEALTNVLRHAPGAASVEVTVRRTPTTVEVDVLDSGGTRPGTGGGTGRGIVGMSERAALLGGHVSAGPRLGGGWQVRAVLPWSDDEDGDAR
ncbi:sensor histidine kinase [Cellulomonas wangsupingiae]|uniref:sensor histidine kinase n=1 Tax=Cellulomonas wangsupingiae TaxID=2968085 RepID=UPI001D0E5EB2|nr:histidine kinase [Cellulomonas wangsupingiae]MCM0640032.1 histidine kinase [Cellulomonas wangsupingiae]